MNKNNSEPTENELMEEISKHLCEISVNQHELLTIVHSLILNFSKLKEQLAEKDIYIDCDLKIKEVSIH